MGIEGIEISKLSGKLQQLATAADDGNGVIENNEIEIFKGYADAAVKNGQVSEDDYKAIFGADIKTTQPATNPQQTTYTKKDVKRMEKYVVTILKEEVAASPSEIKAKLQERLGVNADDPKYKDLQGQVEYILNAINEVGYKSKDDVDKLEKTVKEKLQIGKKDDFAKDVLKALVENAEVAQRSKEYGEIKEAYEKLVKAGMDEEAAYKEARKEFKDKGSYYKDYLKHGNIFYKALHWKRKDSDFEKRTIMPEARATVREAISESDSTSSKGVERDAKKSLEADGDYNRYTKKALGGENNFGEWISGKDSDMKVARKNQATKNEVEGIREDGLSAEEIHDAVDKRSTFGSKVTFGLLFKKKTQLFEALKTSGLIVDKGNGEYDVSKLSMIIGEHVGANYKLDRQSSDFKALAEITKTTSALAVATELKNLRPEEAKMLVEMCGYKVEGKNWGKAILGATIGALVNGLGAGAGAATNDRPIIDTVVENNNHVELNFQATGATLDELIEQFSNVEGATLKYIEGGLQVIVDQQNLVPLFWKASRHIVETALKGAAVGAAFGLLAGLKDSPEKPITSTQFECTTLEEYAKVLDSEAKQKALKPQYKEALMHIAATFIKEDESGNKYWDCEAYKMFLNKAAGNGGVLNREELIGALGELKKDNNDVDDIDDDDDHGNDPVEDEHNYSTHNKEAVPAEYENVPVIDGRTTSWEKIAGQYDCLKERYGLADAIRMIKIAQGINNGDYSKENLEKLLALSKKGLSHMKNVEGLDYEAYKSALQATYLPALKKDNEGNNIPGTGVKVPVELAECTRDASKSLKAEASSNDGEVVDPTGHAADKIKVRDGQPARYYARFDGGAVQEYDSMQKRDQAVQAFKAKYPNAKVEKWSEE